MSMVCGLDLHRGQITFDALEVETGEVWRGRIWSPDRARLRRWLAEEAGASSARRAGWCGGGGGLHRLALCGRGDHRRGLRGACGRAGRHPGGPGPQEAGQDRPLRRPSAAGAAAERRAARELDPAEAVLEWRERTVLYKSLLDQRRVWIQRIHAELFQHGVALPEGEIRSEQTRAWLAGDERAAQPGRPSAHQRRLPDARRHRRRATATQEAAGALRAAPAGLPGPGQRPLRDRPADRGVRVGRAGRLPTVLPLHASGAPHRPGRDRGLLRPPPRRRLPVPARARRHCAGRCSRPARPRPEPASPDYDYYQAVKRAHDGKLAAIAMARKLARRCYHTLRALDPDVVYAMPDRLNLTNTVGIDGPDRPLRTSGSPRSAPATRMPASVSAGRPYNTDATALPTGDTQTRLLSPTTSASSST